MKHLALLAAVYAADRGTRTSKLPARLRGGRSGDRGHTRGRDHPRGGGARRRPRPSSRRPRPSSPRPSSPRPRLRAGGGARAARGRARSARGKRAASARTGPAPEAAASGSVAISDFQFTPAQITIDQGDTVTWTNNGPTAHSATAPDGSFDTGIFPAGQSRSHTFNDAGTFSYICTPHPNMHGTIVVRASQSGGDTRDSSAGDTGGTDGSTDGGSTGAEASQSDDGPSLPNTGSDAGALLVLGALMLLLGVAVHRRARAEQPRPAGRIGW